MNMRPTLMGPTVCSISSSPESEHSRVGTERGCVTSRRGVDPAFRRRAPVEHAHRLRWEVERPSWGGHHGNVLGGGHGGPVPAKLTPTAKEMERVGKRPTPVGTTRYTLRCPHPFPQMVRKNSSLGSFSRFSRVNFPVSRCCGSVSP